MIPIAIDVAGFEKIFYLGHVYRNGENTLLHNPEFTMLEFYQAYATYEDLMRLTEELFEKLSQELCGSTDITYQDEKISLAQPYKRLTVVEALKQAGVSQAKDAEGLRKKLIKAGKGFFPFSCSRKVRISSLRCGRKNVLSCVKREKILTLLQEILSLKT